MNSVYSKEELLWLVRLQLDLHDTWNTAERPRKA